jgi:hypothetical protein
VALDEYCLPTDQQLSLLERRSSLEYIERNVVLAKHEVYNTLVRVVYSSRPPQPADIIP